MKKNDLFSLKITDMGVDGEGIGNASKDAFLEVAYLKASESTMG